MPDEVKEKDVLVLTDKEKELVHKLVTNTKAGLERRIAQLMQLQEQYSKIDKLSVLVSDAVRGEKKSIKLSKETKTVLKDLLGAQPMAQVEEVAWKLKELG